MRRFKLPLLPGAILGLLCLIFDSRCAAESAFEALDLCLRTVIPSLFPMFVLSGLLTAGLSGAGSPWIRRLERLAGLPGGTGGIFLLGAVGGFPVGAQCLAQGVQDQAISKKDASRMLGFCDNCSPGFLFGILGRLFVDPRTPLWVLIIQLETALLAARMWSGTDWLPLDPPKRSCSLPQAVNQGVRSIVSVCAWVILAGVMMGFLQRWLFPLLPEPVPEIIGGLLELTGGVLGLSGVAGDESRLILCAVFVCFGGLCVLMQIQAIASPAGLSMDFCIRQKLFQGAVGGLLAAGVAKLGPWVLVIPVLILFFWKIAVEIPGKTMYNSIHKGG